MNKHTAKAPKWDGRTGVDEVANHLYDDIISLRLLPGTKMSEVEIASRFGVSRQPVREAFSRLANLDLLLIRPQKATEVKRFSTQAIEKSRFIRAAVEAEVLRRAARLCDKEGAAALDASLEQQRALLTTGEYGDFSALDYQFHALLCEIAGVEYAFEVICSEKAKVDRLCVLGLSKEDRMPELIEDHARIVAMIKAHDAEKAVAEGMLHLSRLDSTIEHIKTNNAHFFDDIDTVP
ncbi:GntR family transcriptional regulator [Pseudorhodobacter turbinis]|uniref:GntR family transcriptional regulator n=1 Tax=Pseudorhodobacter turbinis TaxID=2500533 RepID=A0A4P8EGG3_9RHOB|nr:GntR family transcriptional regulator [Pseudorhodobacter turbinis]QCO55879.1 GntR family transcriptional regulator [Pseudorhodobacter turbinis]